MPLRFEWPIFGLLELTYTRMGCSTATNELESEIGTRFKAAILDLYAVLFSSLSLLCYLYLSKTSFNVALFIFEFIISNNYIS